MKREKIMQLACDVQMQFVCADGAVSWIALERFAALVIEECAQVCDRFAERDMHPTECAGAIRSMAK